MNEEAVLELITRKPELKPAKEKLESMQPGSYCIHQSWGFGQIKDYDEESGKLIIDFEQSAPQSTPPWLRPTKVFLDALRHQPS